MYKERNAGLEKDVLREQGRNTALVEAKAKAEAKAESLSSAIKERDTIALTSSKVALPRPTGVASLIIEPPDVMVIVKVIGMTTPHR